MFKPMLAHSKTPDFAELEKKKVFPVIVQPKLDGIRASVVDGKLVSRTLKPIPNEEISEALSRPEYEGLDGELIVGDPTAEDAFNRTTTFVRGRSKTGESWCFYVFDMWNMGEADYFTRYHAAVEIVAAQGRYQGEQRLQMVSGERVENVAELEAEEARLVGLGYEGGIARIPATPYKFGRSGKNGPLLKIKRFIDFEAKVIGVYEEMHNANEAKTNALGRTERSSHAEGKVGKDRLGGLILVALNGPHEGQEFRCGTGFNAQQREDLWKVRNAIGEGEYEVAKIKSFPIGVKDAPRFPVWLGWREDFDR